MSTGNNATLVKAGKRFRGGPCEAKMECHLPSIAPVGPLSPDLDAADWCGHRWSEWRPIEEAIGSAIGFGLIESDQYAGTALHRPGRDSRAALAAPSTVSGDAAGADLLRSPTPRLLLGISSRLVYPPAAGAGERSHRRFVLGQGGSLRAVLDQGLGLVLRVPQLSLCVPMFLYAGGISDPEYSILVEISGTREPLAHRPTSPTQE
jgi:hypothetical protein